MDDMKSIKFRFKACNPPNCGCPDVEFEGGLVTINDDFGGKVKLTIQELEFIAGKTQNLIELARADLVKQQDSMNAEIAKARKGV